MTHTLSIARATAGIVLCLMLLGPTKSPESATKDLQTATPTDMQTRAEVCWKKGMKGTWKGNNIPEIYLNLSLIVRGGVAADATACGDVKVASIQDGSGRSLKGELRDFSGMFLTQGQNCANDQPRDGVRISLELYDLPPLTKIREFRGSFALRTGGQLQTVVIQNVLQQPDHLIRDETLKRLGVAVRMNRTTSASQIDENSFTLSPPTPADELGFEMQAGANAVLRLDIADAHGKQLTPMSERSESDMSIKKANFAFKDKLPNDVQLRIAIHRDAQTIRVPFAVQSIDVPPPQTLDEDMDGDLHYRFERSK